jgi:hypothetical protein
VIAQPQPSEALATPRSGARVDFYKQSRAIR